METNNPVPATYDAGKELFSWTAHDYHPHERGTLWYIISSILILGIALWAFVSDPKWGWITSATILIFAAMYFWMHKNGNEDHEVRCFERGILIDGQKYAKWKEFEGFWFIYNETASILNLEYNGNKGKQITLQMGNNSPESFRERLELLELVELTDKKEATLDLWIRALKL